MVPSTEYNCFDLAEYVWDSIIIIINNDLHHFCLDFFIDHIGVLIFKKILFFIIFHKKTVSLNVQIVQNINKRKRELWTKQEEQKLIVC